MLVFQLKCPSWIRQLISSLLIDNWDLNAEF